MHVGQDFAQNLYLTQLQANVAVTSVHNVVDENGQSRLKKRGKRQRGAGIDLLRVRRAPGSKTRGLMLFDGRAISCALGRSGVRAGKREGDGKTPFGRFGLLSMMLRADKIRLRNLRFRWTSIRSDDGWCDEAGHRLYNAPVALPFPASHERLKRDDHLYDIVVVMDHNITRHLSVGGSAIFFHLAHDDYRATEGCVAIARHHMEWLVPRIGPKTVMIVE